MSSMRTVHAPRSLSYSSATAAIAVLDSALDKEARTYVHVSALNAGTSIDSWIVPADIVTVVIAASSKCIFRFPDEVATVLLIQNSR